MSSQPHPVTGHTQVLAPPYRIDGERLPIRRSPPQLGADTQAVLQEWGASAESHTQLQPQSMEKAP